MIEINDIIREFGGDMFIGKLFRDLKEEIFIYLLCESRDRLYSRYSTVENCYVVFSKVENPDDYELACDMIDSIISGKVVSEDKEDYNALNIIRKTIEEVISDFKISSFLKYLIKE
jgi:hypothetical protein